MHVDFTFQSRNSHIICFYERCLTYLNCLDIHQGGIKTQESNERRTDGKTMTERALKQTFRLTVKSQLLTKKCATAHHK